MACHSPTAGFRRRRSIPSRATCWRCLLGNVSPSIYRETLIEQNDNDQTGARIDLSLSNRDQLFGRYSYSGGNNFNPVSVRGSDAPGFPTRDDFSTHSLNVSSTRILSSSLTNTVRGNFLRHKFFFDQRLNRTPPSALGFGYEPVHEIGQGPPFFNVSGYTPIGGAITGPRNTTQHTFELQDSVTWARGNHLLKFGGEYVRTNIDMFQDRAERVLHIFRLVPDQQCRCQSAPRRTGRVLSRLRRLFPRGDCAGRRPLRTGRVAHRGQRDAESRTPLRAHQSAD